MASSVERLAAALLPTQLAVLIALIRALNAEPTRPVALLRVDVLLAVDLLPAQHLHVLAEVAIALRRLR